MSLSLIFKKSIDPAARNFPLCYADAFFYHLMVGMGESYIAAFVLVMGLSDISSGLIQTVPLLIGGLLQLISPVAVTYFKSYRKWVVVCAFTQACCFIPLTLSALNGSMHPLVVFSVSSIYWGSGMAAGTAWNAWKEGLIPRPIRAMYLAHRARLAQLSTLIAFVAVGFALNNNSRSTPETLSTFATIFFIAFLCRATSGFFLAKQSDGEPHHNIIKPIRFKQHLRNLFDRQKGHFLVYLFATYFCVYLAAPFFSPYMLKFLGLPYSDYMILIAVSFAAKVATLPLWGKLIARFGPKNLLWLCGFLIVPLAGLWSLLPSFGYLVFFQFMAGFAWSGFELATLMLIFDSIPYDERTGLLSVYNILYALSLTVGSALGGVFLKYAGETMANYHTLFLISSVCRAFPLLLLFGKVETSTPYKKFKPLYHRPLGLRPNSGSINQPVISDLSEEKGKKEG